VRDHEPSLALQGGADGLALIRELLDQAPHYLRHGGAVCLEFGSGQAQSLLQEVRIRLPAAEVRISDDFAGLPRVLIASLQRE
jgi:release factor glutamine methyltransferase